MKKLFRIKKKDLARACELCKAYVTCVTDEFSSETRLLILEELVTVLDAMGLEHGPLNMNRNMPILEKESKTRLFIIGGYTGKVVNKDPKLRIV